MRTALAVEKKGLSGENEKKLSLLNSKIEIDVMAHSAYEKKDVDDLNQTIKKYDKLIQRSENLHWNTFTGLIYLSLGNAYQYKSWLARESEGKLMSKAIECWDKAVRLNPELQEQVQFKKKDYKWDKKHLPSFEEEYTNKAYDIWDEAKEKQDKSEEVDLDTTYNKALDLLNKVINKSPDYAPAYRVLGDIYFDRKMYNKAKETYDKAIKLNPDDKHTHYSLAEYYLSQSQPKKAIKEAEKILEIDSKDVFAPDYIEEANQQLKSKNEN
jgi:tetratricopeptide (TPR) repeat protein